MPHALARLALLALLVLPLAAKGAIQLRPPPAEAPDSPAAITAFLTARGFAVTPPHPDTAPQWFDGRHGDCRVRIADVSPDGWYRSVVALEAEGDEVRYAYRGRFHPDQPALATKLDAYWRKARGHAGFAPPPVVVRAVLVSPACPADVLGADAAAALGS